MAESGARIASWVLAGFLLAGAGQVSAEPGHEHPESKDAAKPESNFRDLILPEPLEGQPEPEDRLVILPEIKREGERYFLSSFKLPDKITFGGVPVPLDNWQVRERIEYEFYQFQIGRAHV